MLYTGIASFLILYMVVTELLDWTGRMELIQNHLPRFARVAEHRPFRLILLLVCLGLWAKVWTDRPKEQPKIVTQKNDPRPTKPIEQENRMNTSLGVALPAVNTAPARSSIHKIKRTAEGDSPLVPQTKPESKTGSVEMHIAPGGAGSVNQSGGITAANVVVNGSPVCLVKLKNLLPSPADRVYGDSDVLRFELSLSTLVPDFELFAFAPNLSAFNFASDKGFTALDFSQGDTLDGNGKFIRFRQAYGTYTFVAVKVRSGRVDLRYRCGGIECVDH